MVQSSRPGVQARCQFIAKISFGGEGINLTFSGQRLGFDHYKLKPKCDSDFVLTEKSVEDRGLVRGVSLTLTRYFLFRYLPI